MKNELFLWEFSGEEAADLHNPPTRRRHQRQQAQRAGGAAGGLRGGDAGSSAAQGGSESTWTDHKETLHAGNPPAIPPHPHPPHLLIYTHKHSRTLVSPPAHTHTNAQWTLIEELVYYVRSTSTTVGSRKMDDADKALVPSHINLITSLAVFFFSR